MRLGVSELTVRIRDEGIIDKELEMVRSKLRETQNEKMKVRIRHKEKKAKEEGRGGR